MYHANLVGALARPSGTVPVVWGTHHNALDHPVDKSRTILIRALLSRRWAIVVRRAVTTIKSCMGSFLRVTPVQSACHRRRQRLRATIYNLTGLAALLSASWVALPGARVPAFPGAQGGGAAAIGGRGGSVCEVTSLNDSGENSLRDCLTRSGARTVIFRTTGIIWLKTGIYITNPYITIAGQTAPGGGIILGGKLMNTDSMIYIETHDVVVRYIRLRVGSGPGHFAAGIGGVTGFFVGNADVYNVILDHISISWTDNKPVTVWANYGPGIHNFTMQWTMTNEGFAGHAVGSNVGNQNGTYSAFTDVDFHHNFWSDHSHRLPLTGQKTMHMVNNIIYNWSYYATGTEGPQSSDIIGNLYKPGPYYPRAYKYEMLFNTTGGASRFTGIPSIYLLDNKGPNQPNSSGDQWAMANMDAVENGAPAGSVPANWRRDVPLPIQAFPIEPDDVNNLENILLPTVGASQRLDCNGKWVLNRDAVDTRLVNEYKAGTGIIPTSENDVGGFPTIDPGTPCADSDHDGIPDAWEIAHGLNPNDPSDGPKLNRDGYSSLEYYLNGVSPTTTKHFKGRPQNLSPRTRVP
jgi:pectate lyase